jgi:hypothetical protein
MFESINVSEHNIQLIVHTSICNNIFCIIKKGKCHLLLEFKQIHRMPYLIPYYLAPYESESRLEETSPGKWHGKRTEPSLKSVLQHGQAALNKVETCMDRSRSHS